MSLSPAAVVASSLFGMVETDFFGLILFFWRGCGKSGGGVGAIQLSGSGIAGEDGAILIGFRGAMGRVGCWRLGGLFTEFLV
jgi:hypothetical protein